jgi:hypothetical protein
MTAVPRRPASAEPVCCVLPVTAERAWQLLEDPRSLKLLVVGARVIRRFDSRWPDAGTVVHHTIGVRPLVIRDTTAVTRCEPGRRLVLEARLRPLGRFEVDFALRDHEQGSLLEVRERVISGCLAAGPLAALANAAVRVRNRELCRRFRRLVEHRELQLERLKSSRAGSSLGAADA